MFVRSRMTTKCYCVSPDDSLAKVYTAMKDKGFEGLPVAEDGHVVGVITLWDIVSRLAQIDHTEAYLRTTKVGDIMTRQPVTIRDDEIIEEAALLMYKNDINILPVVDASNNVVGVLTQSDFFRIFVEVLGLERKGTRITLTVDDRVGELSRITEVIKKKGVSIISLVTFEPEKTHSDVVIRLETVQPKPVVDALVEAGFRVTHVSQVWA